MKIKLFGYWRSTSTWRVRLALALKQVPFEYEAVHLLRNGGEQNTERYRALNPMRTVPMVEITDDRGTLHRVAQSLAIVELLEELYPQPSLLPQAPFLRARARQLAEIINSGIQPLQNTAVNQWIKEQLHADERAWSRVWLERGLQALERLIPETAGQFCIGDAVSVADICLVPQLRNARRFDLDVSPYQTLTRIEAACQKLPAFEAALPERQPDAVPN